MEIPNKFYIVGLLLIGLIIRLMAFQSGFMFTADVNLFQFWGQQMFEHGLSTTYTGEFIHFIDYPPGYLYVLYALGGLASLFDWPRLHPVFNFFTFLPAIIADLVIGYVIYRMAAYGHLSKIKDKVKGKDLPIRTTIHALKMSALWVLNPAIIFISAMWGQVESVFVVFLMISLLLLKERRIVASYLLFALAILIKAQSLFLAPVYLYSAYSYIRDSKNADSGFDTVNKAIEQLVIAIFSSVILLVLLSMPIVPGFNIMPVVRIYTGGLGTHAWASVNAFNFWGLVTNVGRSWVPIEFYQVVTSIIVVVLLIVGSIYALHRDHVRHNGKHYFLIVGALFALIFIFVIRMHERYLFPALAFFLLYYTTRNEKRGLGLYAAFSVTFLVNCVQVVQWLRAGAHGSYVMATTAPIFSTINVLLGAALVFMFVRTKWMEQDVSFSHAEPAPAKNIKHKSKDVQPVKPVAVEPPPMSTRDYILICGLIIIYSIVAFVRLGDMEAPQTAWAPEVNETAIIDFGQTHQVHAIQYRMSASRVHWGGSTFNVTVSSDGVHWSDIGQVYAGMTTAFNWERHDMHFYGRYVQITVETPEFRMQEIAFRGPDWELIPIDNVSAGAEAIVDEQHMVPEYRSFMNSTYFDEIYHARAGYEYLHGINVFENTHPPLGKNFIMWSIRVFGMTPFGWRFPGTLAGVLMIPLLYALARLLFKSNNWGLFAAAVFTFDFMHFAQTRIATIDSYVTLFIIAMYLFMFMFVHGVERGDSLKRKMIILALCGISVGLAAAAKWQGVYAILGLPFVFFPALYKQYLYDSKQATRIFYACFGFFIAIPLVIYVLSYIPFVAATGGGGLRNVWGNQMSMFSYHSGLVAEHGFSSIWWEWPLVLRPIWLYGGNYVDGVRGTIASFGNPAVWWLGVVATIYMLFYGVTGLTPLEFIAPNKPGNAKKVRAFKGFDTAVFFIVVGYAAQYLPWVGISRLTWIYHYFPSVPFVVLTITWAFKHIIDRRPSLRVCAIGYVVIVAGLFALFYPVLSGLPISTEFVRTYLQWLPRWHF